MTKKAAKTIALQKCCSVIENLVGTDILDNYSAAEQIKIEKEIAVIAKSLYNRACKLGWDFNKYLGE